MTKTKIKYVLQSLQIMSSTTVSLWLDTIKAAEQSVADTKVALDKSQSKAKIAKIELKQALDEIDVAFKRFEETRRVLESTQRSIEESKRETVLQPDNNSIKQEHDTDDVEVFTSKVSKVSINDVDDTYGDWRGWKFDAAIDYNKPTFMSNPYLPVESNPPPTHNNRAFSFQTGSSYLNNGNPYLPLQTFNSNIQQHGTTLTKQNLFVQAINPPTLHHQPQFQQHQPQTQQHQPLTLQQQSNRQQPSQNQQLTLSQQPATQQSLQHHQSLQYIHMQHQQPTVQQHQQTSFQQYQQQPILKQEPVQQQHSQSHMNQHQLFFSYNDNTLYPRPLYS